MSTETSELAAPVVTESVVAPVTTEVTATESAVAGTVTSEVAAESNEHFEVALDPAGPAVFRPFRERIRKGIAWPSVTWLVFLHIGALAAPFYFTWKGVLLALILGWVTGGIGICLGYHRLLTHSSFTTFRPVRWVIALLGNLAGQGSPLMWVAQHRKHHAFSDKEGDPHSPRHGKWWSHMLWLAPRFDKGYYNALYKRYAPDILKDRGMQLLDKTFILWYFLVGGGLFALGYFGWDSYTGMSFVVYGMFVRLVYVLHATWFVNSASHIWGYRNYETRDDSKNLWWVGMLTYGEGWHNNHHAYQRMARHGHRWWEVDVTYWAICVLEKLGLAWDVVHDQRHTRPTG